MASKLPAVRLNTIGQIEEHGYALRLDCPSCARGADVDLPALLRQLGRDFTLPELRRHAACPHCGGAVTLTMRLEAAGTRPDGHPMAIRLKPRR
ncbi:hypothetical protein [Zavarzinia compransoris]|uniref:Uncharacterized protein n=1 Tax=Zavarzinia compransoris TaxID=1264899 RepID=A0A317EA60_9PROT|nr:hypothetical protein [Zavarzinia compransoris]PWR22193.1 hypothetical protein DKG75_09510 [Zavarzinia compransoris]TDP47054.1 hypothetical protein DES42_103222 [Zavarzinia compransoris]